MEQLGEEVIPIRQRELRGQRFVNSSTTDWNCENEVTIEKENVESKVIFLADVKVKVKGEIKEVPTGYAQLFDQENLAERSQCPSNQWRTRKARSQ